MSLLVPKIDELREVIHNSDVEIACITETWLSAAKELRSRQRIQKKYYRMLALEYYHPFTKEMLQECEDRESGYL
jgi:pyruvate/2-oxoacid:ferredoxin oxidoreductase alpha subunit